MNALETALLWRALGIACIPILAGSKRPALDTWERWQHELPSEAKLRAWFATGYGIAVVCGWCGLTVVDFDSLERLKIWLASPQGQVDTYKVQTHKGWHYYFYIDEPTNCGAALWNFCQECQEWTLHRMVPVKMLECLECQAQSESGQEQRIDIKGIGGQAITPPSIHPSGHVYTGVGDPTKIAHLDSIKDILPEYEPSVYVPASRQTDPYDLAMREPVGTSVEAIKATWRWEEVLPVNGTARRGVMMVNCPFHADEHASMALYPDKHAHCFGCGQHMDIIDVFAALHNLTIQEAMREMAR